MLAVIYNEFLHEALNLVNEYTHTCRYMHIKRLIKCSS